MGSAKRYDVLVNGESVYAGPLGSSTVVYTALARAFKLLGVDATVCISFRP